MAKRSNEFDELSIHKKKLANSFFCIKNKNVNQTSTFETMSNELFMELFEYFDLYSLYFTFYSLNSRFNSIISHCQVHVDFNQINPLYFTSFIGHFIYSNIEKGRIRSLQSSIPHQIAILVDDIVS
jgi:hypothetical protein